jgi:hypothetical protein
MTSPLRTDFNDFLFSPVGDDSNGMHLTLLSVLARSGVDPWLEAADLAALSRESATQKLVSLLAGVPNGPGADTETVASRLVALLHAAPKPRAEAARAAPPLMSRPTTARRVRIAIYYLIPLVALILGNWALSARNEPSPIESSIPAPL